MIGLIAEQIYEHLDEQRLLPEEQNEFRERCRGTNDLLCTERTVIREVKSKKKSSNDMDRL